MLKLRFFAPSQARLFRRSFFASFRFCFFLAVLAFVVVPCESFAQNRPFNRTADQTIRTTPGYPTQRRAVLDRANSNGVAIVPSDGAPAPLTNADVQTRPTSAAPAQRAATSTSGSQSASVVRRSDAQGSQAPSTVSPQTTAPKDDENGKRYLEYTNGQYSFLRLAKNERDFASVRVSSDSLIVVVPRKNFIETEKNAREDVEESSDDQVLDSESSMSSESLIGDLVSSEVRSVKKGAESVVVDDYVAFILTNLDDDERILLRDAQNGVWDSTDLLSASLIAEGLTTPQKRAHYRSVYGRLLATLKPKVERVSEPFQKSEIVYNFLHNTALTSKYDLNSSSVARALDSGAFNCVSATVLFNCFAKASGLNVVALETKGHAKSRVKFEDSFLDIETTCSDWNRLPDRVRPYAQSGKATKDLRAIAEGGVPARLDSAPIIRGNVEDVKSAPLRSEPSTASLTYDAKTQNEVDKSKQASESEAGSTSFEIDLEAPLGYSFTRVKRPMHEISEVELVATIYYNAGVDYCQVGDYERAVASYVKAVQLAPNNLTVIGNLKATLNNWAINLAAKEKRYDAAIQITLFGLAIDPNFEEFNVNLPIFFSDWVEYLAKDNKWEEIKQVQEQSKKILATIPE